MYYNADNLQTRNTNCTWFGCLSYRVGIYQSFKFLQIRFPLFFFEPDNK